MRADRYPSPARSRPTRLDVRVAFLLLLLSLSTGCLYVGWDDVPGAKLRPEIHATYLANATFDNTTYWTAEVAHAAAIWNDAAVAAGCGAPFSIVDDDPSAHAIRLVPRAAWPYADDKIGMYIDEYADPDDVGFILIRERRPRASSHVPVLLHELGHAIGLTHDDHPDAVMTDVVDALEVLQPRDLARMRDALGC